MNKSNTSQSLAKRINIPIKHLDPAANLQEAQRTAGPGELDHECTLSRIQTPGSHRSNDSGSSTEKEKRGTYR